MEGRPSFSAAWYAQWKSASAALEKVHDAELRALTDEDALRRADALLSLAARASLAAAAERRATSGLVEQQALFARSRR